MGIENSVIWIAHCIKTAWYSNNNSNKKQAAKKEI